jgi:hypothetical protein
MADGNAVVEQSTNDPRFKGSNPSAGKKLRTDKKAGPKRIFVVQRRIYNN